MNSISLNCFFLWIKFLVCVQNCFGMLRKMLKSALFSAWSFVWLFVLLFQCLTEWKRHYGLFMRIAIYGVILLTIISWIVQTHFNLINRDRIGPNFKCFSTNMLVRNAVFLNGISEICPLLLYTHTQCRCLKLMKSIRFGTAGKRTTWNNVDGSRIEVFNPIENHTKNINSFLSARHKDRFQFTIPACHEQIYY